MTQYSLAYPTTLPLPKEAPIQSSERRTLSQRPFEARAYNRDRLAVQQILWPVMNDSQAAIFEEWGETSLISWGAWFSATWPLPQGMVVGVRRFMTPPTRRFVPGGFWQYGATMEVRGRGELPVAFLSDCLEAGTAAEIAIAEPNASALWSGNAGDAPTSLERHAYEVAYGRPIEGSYTVLGRSPGAVGPGSSFPATYTVAWSDLPEPPGIAVFNFSRAGNYPGSTASATIVVTGAPTDIDVPLCRACIFQAIGSWSGAGTDGHPKGYWASTTLPVQLPGGSMTAGHTLWTADIGGGAGVSQCAFLIKNESGAISGQFVS